MSDAAPSAIAELCPQCQMCCNGVLFADVELEPQDSRDQLKSLGVNLRRKGRRTCFDQPCAQLKTDGLCKIYGDRPTMCAEFECAVLLRVSSGEWSGDQAMAKIRRARQLERKVRRLLALLGNTDEQLALTKRYQQIMMEPIDCAADEELVEARGELMLTVQDLMDLASRHFLALPE